MQLASIGALAPVAVLISAFTDCSLISLPFLLAFFFIQYKSLWRGINSWIRDVFWGLLLLYSAIAIFAESITVIVWFIKGKSWNTPPILILKLFGLSRFNPWVSLSHVLVVLSSHSAVFVTAACALKEEENYGNLLDFSWGGSSFRAVLRSILLPAVQLIAGVARPCWISFPFFICSCVGLLHWSITSNFVGLSWGWSQLLLFTGFDIIGLYMYQLPFEYPVVVLKVADYMGLFQVSQGQCGWPEVVQSIALVAFYILLSVAIYDVEEEGEHSFYCKDVLPRTCTGPMLALSQRSNEDKSLTESLLGSPKMSCEKETRPVRSWTTTPPNCKILQLISINFFTYCFPACLVILLLWSFKYASIIAFFILLYVGYVLLTFPSVPILWRLNTALLAFILFWALCTYSFNAIFTVLHDELDKDTKVWNTIGFWHYPVPGVFLLAQFVLGVLVGAAMYFSNVALRNMHITAESSAEDGKAFEEDKHDWKILLLAVMTWCIHRSAHAISLAVIFLVGVRHGLIGAIYMLFFLIYLLRPKVATRTRQYLVIICEIHFGALYLLQLDLISQQIDGQWAWMNWILSELGISNYSSPGDFLLIASLLTFSALQNRGLGLLLSISALVKKSQLPPWGFDVLKSASSGPIFEYVCASHKFDHIHHESNTTVKWIMQKLSDVGDAVCDMYRSFRTPIVAVTVLLVVYSLGPNYIAFGYLVLLLFWMTGRQLLGRTWAPLWFPLFLYTIVVFIFRYVITCFPQLEKLIGKNVDLYSDLGFKPATSFFCYLWDSLLILIVMQLFRYEHTQKRGREASSNEGDHIDACYGYVALVKRFLILHSNKLLSVTVFYASMSPVGATGFVYLLMLVATSVMPKVSRIPAMLFSLYTALLMAAEFLYQMLGAKLQILPEQAHGPFAFWLGFRVFPNSFWGFELGFQSRVLVFASCLLQYSACGWLKLLPESLQSNGRLDEPCFLFVPYPRRANEAAGSASEREPFLDSIKPFCQLGLPEVHSDPGILAETAKLRMSHSLRDQITHLSDSKCFTGVEASPDFGVGMNGRQCEGLGLNSSSRKQSRQWSKRAMLILRRERYEAQLRTLRIYAKHLTENFFNIFGLEISMLVLLFASFAVLNVISLLYIIVLSLCIILNRQTLRLLWPFFVFLSAFVLVFEYIALGKGPPSWIFPYSVAETSTDCQTCWEAFQANLDYCTKCWLGVVVDDSQLLIAYFIVFFISCLKLRAYMNAGKCEGFSLRNVVFPPSDRLAWKEINYETKGQWTWLDRLRFSFYLHFLDILLLLVLITGTFQYDGLHLGYLAFALVFFRMRVKILKTRNRAFWFLRLYNFALIVLSLLYQAPYFGDSGSKQYIVYDMIGFVKIPYGVDRTTQSVLVDITIFCVVAFQSSLFSSKEFEQVLRYLEAEEMAVKLKAQEVKAAWKSEQLLCIRNMEELKHHRHLQVEKMKSEMLHLQLNVDVLNSSGRLMKSSAVELSNHNSKGHDWLYDRCNPFNVDNWREITASDDDSVKDKDVLYKNVKKIANDVSYCRRRRSYPCPEYSSSDESSASLSMENNDVKKYQKIDEHVNFSEILEEDSTEGHKTAAQTKNVLEHQNSADGISRQSYQSGVQIISSGVSHVQSFGHKALANIVGLLNIEQDHSDDTEGSSVEEEAEALKSEEHINGNTFLRPSDTVIKSDCVESSHQKEVHNEMWHDLYMLSLFCYSKIRSNIDVVCFFFFLLAYIWDFSLLMLVYPASLFLYALIVNPGPGQHFWLGVLIYTELNILLQYINQVLLHHSVHKTLSYWWKLWLGRVGIPITMKSNTFVVTVLPLFLVYLSTLLQSSINARDGEWMSVLKRSALRNKVSHSGSWIELLHAYLVSVKEKLASGCRGLWRYCLALIYGCEAPPHFVQVTLKVNRWPEDGIQPERIESGFNRLLRTAHHSFCGYGGPEFNHSVSSVRVESIESSQHEANIAIAVLEVIYASPVKGCPASDHYTSLTPAKDVAWEIQRAKDEGLVDDALFPFPILSVIPGGKREVDLYAYIFGTDLVAFFFVAIFYQSFKKNSPDFFDVYHLEDQFPKEFVFVLMTLFFLIILDRVIYLCSFAPGKICYYFGSLGLFTYYATHYDRQMIVKEHGLFLLRMFCLIKGLSLSLQALQIKYGLPHKTALYEQFLMRKVSHLNHIGFRLYRSLPFLFELRCILDWSCSTTALTMYDWLKLEDIYASLFLVQCDAKLSREKHHLGEKRGVRPKFFSGICTFLTLICIIWTPMLMYSSGNPTNFANPIMSVHAQIDLNTKSGNFILYQTSFCRIFSMEDFVASRFIVDDHLKAYDLRDVQLICCEADSDSLWLVPPPILRSLTDLIHEEFTVIARWEFSRERPKTYKIADFNNKSFGINLNEADNETFNALRVPELYPRYFRITSTGEVRMLEGTIEVVGGNLTLNQASQSWWSFSRDNASSDDACGSLGGLIAITVSEEVPQGFIGDTLSKFSITSLYITFVLAVGRFIRMQCADLRMRIPYENLPSCDRLVAICEDIYAARAAGELTLEEGLFWTLVRIYRSPHALLEYTKVD